MYGDSSLDGGVMHTTSNQIWCMDVSLEGDMSRTILGQCDLDL